MSPTEVYEHMNCKYTSYASLMLHFIDSLSKTGVLNDWEMGQQEDAHEFLVGILERITKELHHDGLVSILKLYPPEYLAFIFLATSFSIQTLKKCLNIKIETVGKELLYLQILNAWSRLYNDYV